MTVELREHKLQGLLNCGRESKIAIWNCGMNFNHLHFLHLSTIEVNVGVCSCPLPSPSPTADLSLYILLQPIVSMSQ